MSEHTKEPWECGDPIGARRLWPTTYIHAAGPTGRHVATTGGYSDSTEPNTLEINEANARRIVACVNACKGIPTESLANGVAKGVYIEDIERVGWNAAKRLKEAEALLRSQVRIHEAAIASLKTWNGMGLDDAAAEAMWALYEGSPEVKQLTDAIASIVAFLDGGAS